MNNQQNPEAQSDFQQMKSQKNTILLIIISVIIGGVVLVGSGVGILAYRNVQKEAQEAKLAKEKSDEEKRELQRQRDVERKAAEEKRLKQEAEERERQEQLKREEEEKLRREEEEKLKREEAEKKRLQEEANKPKGLVSDVRMQADTRIIDGQFDAGFEVTGYVKNSGVSGGDIKIAAFLSCSEGEWIRIQHLYFRAGESMRLTYFFHEPTINATSCQARIVTSSP